ncbi:hypothetical protein OIDMADRAFT_20417 [Oidiodendron maius Zn]|uniref:Uncharacterized protein n=1 Tax=Oidiodendron maius (strain Zn) TaxID=913774 RepID=A0A0C3H487_OIDMZ|nr:hypothetical protein OIDMADRAFT_20417 [Oidiodendron maius Zn]
MDSTREVSPVIPHCIPSVLKPSVSYLPAMPRQLEIGRPCRVSHVTLIKVRCTYIKGSRCLTTVNGKWETGKLTPNRRSILCKPAKTEICPRLSCGSIWMKPWLSSAEVGWPQL